MPAFITAICFRRMFGALLRAWFTIFARRFLGIVARFTATIPIPAGGPLRMRMLGWCAGWLRVIPPVVFHGRYCAGESVGGQRGKEEKRNRGP